MARAIQTIQSHGTTVDRYFIRLAMRGDRKFTGDACVWFRPEDEPKRPYRASVSLFKETRRNIYESVCRSQEWFKDIQSAEMWISSEYRRLLALTEK
jgi:hypothetical protein